MSRLLYPALFCPDLETRFPEHSTQGPGYLFHVAGEPDPFFAEIRWTDTSAPRRVVLGLFWMNQHVHHPLVGDVEEAWPRLTFLPSLEEQLAWMGNRVLELYRRDCECHA